MPRAWLTGDTPASEELECRSISVPADLALTTALAGAILPLTEERNWEQHGTMTPAEAAEIFSLAFEEFIDSECGAVCPPPTLPDGSRIWRPNPVTGNWEYLDDTGETWIEPVGEDAIPSPVERGELTSDEMKCAAATNAVNILSILYSQILTNINDELDAIQNALNLAYLVGTRLGGAFYPPVVAFLTLGAGIWNSVIEIAQALSVDLWDAEFTERLVCIFKEHSTEVAGVVTFDRQAINRDILAEIWENSEYILLVSQVVYLTEVIGTQGLNVAGGTTDLEGDCAGCDEWCRVFDFTASPQNWSSFILGTFITTAGTWISGTGFQGTIAVDNAGARGINVVIRVPGSGSINRIAVTYSRTNGQYTSTIPASQLALDYNGSTWTLLQQVNSVGSAGTDLVQQWTGADTDFTGNVVVRMSASIRSGANPSPLGSLVISSITLSGIGVNPFGVNNCE